MVVVFLIYSISVDDIDIYHIMVSTPANSISLVLPPFSRCAAINKFKLFDIFTIKFKQIEKLKTFISWNGYPQLNGNITMRVPYFQLLNDDAVIPKVSIRIPHLGLQGNTFVNSIVKSLLIQL